MEENRSIESQITSYLAGECTPAEQQAIAGLISANQEYKRLYEEFRQIWNSTEMSPFTEAYDIDTAWLKVGKHINESPLTIVHHTQAKKPVLKRILSYAASIAAVLLVAFSVYQVSHNNHSVLKSFASGKSVSSPVSLSDGSRIVLNAGSEVKYPEKFGSDGREVYFWGEAFFEIASDPTRPFVIETGDARIKVLGTSFNVKAYPNTGITEVVVNTGTVLFYHVDENNNILGQVILHKGEKGVYNRTTHKLARMQNDDLNYISWKTNILVFNATSLDKVMAVVGEKYGVTFHIDSAELSHLKLTATFDNESLDSVLEVLRLVHKLQFTHNGKDYLVKKVTG
jgi:transmembrane sensor